MKIVIVISLSFFAIISCKKQGGTSQANLLNSGFEFHLGGNQDDRGSSILLDNGKLYVFGTTKSMGEPNGDYYLIKLDTDGTVLFEKTFGGGQEEDGIKILKSNDGNFLLLGSTTSAGFGMKDINLMKVNSDGDLLWEQTYGYSQDEYPSSIIEKSNGDLIISATSESFFNERDIYLVWTDQNGNQLQDKLFSGPLNDGTTDLIEMENNDIMLHGYTNSFGAISQDLFLMRLDSSGDSLWTKRYGGADYEESQGFARTVNGDFIMNGHSASTDPLHDMYTVRVKPNGNQIWEKNFGGAIHDGGTTMTINNEGNLVLLARSMSFGAGDRNIYMVTANLDGTMLSEDVIGGENDDWALDIIEEGGFYYIVGYSNSEDVSNDDVYLVKYKKK